MIAVLACLAATSASVGLRVHAVTTGPVAGLAAQGATVTAEITLTDDPRISRGRFQQERVVVPANLEIYRTAGQRVAVRTPVTVFANGAGWRSLLPSQRLEVTARLAEATPGDLVSAVLLVRGPPRVLTQPSRSQAVAGALRAGLRTASDVLPADQRGLLPGLVVGDVSRMDPQVSADLKEAGLSHLNAVSGTNLSIVAGAALALSRLAGLPLVLRAVFAAVAMIAFAVVARPSPSVLRALLMGLVAAVALGTGRAKDGVAALSAAVLLLILFAPELSRSYGFALSVLATAGILLLAPRWRDRLSSPPPEPNPAAGPHPDDGVPPPTSPRRVAYLAGPKPPPSGEITPASDLGVLRRPARRRGVWARLLVRREAGARLVVRREAWARRLMRRETCARSVGESGAHARLAGGCGARARLPRWAAEAVAVPAAAQAAVTPVLVLMAGQLSPVAVPANLLAGPAVAPATLLGFAAALVAPFWPEAAQLLIIPAGYAVGWIIMVARWAVNLPMATLPWPGGMAGLGLLAVTVAAVALVWRRRAWRAVTLAVAGGALVAVLVIRPIASPWPPKAWLMVMCDVGQGDGLVIAAGPGRGVVVDTGPDPVTMDRCLRTLGIRDVPLVILTHPHADHVDGLPGVLRGRRVGAVVVSPQRTASGRPSSLSGDLSRRRIPEWTAPPGTRWQLGPSELTVLAPAQEHVTGQGEGSEVNNSSIVVHVRWRAGSALLSGDIEIEAQEQLLRGPLPRADILKVPHHGSPRQDPAFFAAVGARAALISVGADNDYGHPAQPTIALLNGLGARVHRTDRSGDLAVVEQNGTLAVVARGR
ncbi:ComEC/Rec2 family competence protein [Nonomuraea sp. NPDC048916]|uniref:ComEC/Rec2 family competence protein n=1 Tax=Nonomuraea sp. NPDC048916 TaxID=3154232 RepID=UPI0033F0AB79